jgi:tight adherence protein C
MTPVLAAGALCGLGLYLVLRLLVGPSGGPGAAAVALAELDTARARVRREAAQAADAAYTGESLRLRRLGAELLDAAADHGVHLPRDLVRDLALVGRSPGLHLVYSLIAALAMFAAVLLGTTVFGGLALGSTGIGITPLWAGLVGALAGALGPTVLVRSRATDRRRDMRHVVGSFLDLVAMNLSGGRGVPEALQSAASISDSWAMVRIRDALETARLHGMTAWAALGGLGEQTGIDELRDLAAALALVADDGAKVRESLAARAVSLRRRELSDAEGRAQARSQSMLVAQLLLALGFLLFLVYPAVARIVSS